MPPKKRRAFSAPKPPKLPKAPQAQESYLQSFQATQYTHDNLLAVAIQPLEASVALEAIQQAVVKDIKKDKLRAVFKAYSKTAKDKADEVDKTKLLELSAKEVIRMGLSTVLTLQEPIAAIPKLDLKVINLPGKFIFATWYASKPISSFNAGAKSNNLSN